MRQLIFVLCVWLIPGTVAAEGQWIDAAKGCRVWNANPMPNESITWSGACANGFANGGGVLQWFKNGKPTDRYSGTLADGKRLGRGVFTTAQGQRYEGEFSDDRFHGRGVYTWPSGSRYEGDFRDGKRHGEGVYTWANGNKYKGNWANGRAQGTGTFTKADGTVFSGEWSNGCFRQGDRKMAVGATLKECGFD